MDPTSVTIPRANGRSQERLGDAYPIPGDPYAVPAALDPMTCSLEQFAAFMRTRFDRETVRRYAQICYDREYELFAETDAEFAAYDDAMRGQPSLFGEAA